MKKIIKLIIILLTIFLIPSSARSDSDSTFHTAKIGGNNTYFNIWAGNNNFGNFWDRGFLTIQEEVLETIQWFNTELFRNNTTGGAISHFILLFSVIGLVTLAETTINPALMLMAGMAIFFFGWLVVLSVSIMVGFFLFPFSAMYMVRIGAVMREG